METKSVSLFNLFSLNTRASPLPKTHLLYLCSRFWPKLSTLLGILDVFLKYFKLDKFWLLNSRYSLSSVCNVLGDISDRSRNKLRWGICEWEFPLGVWLKMDKQGFVHFDSDLIVWYYFSFIKGELDRNVTDLRRIGGNLKVSTVWLVIVT